MSKPNWKDAPAWAQWLSMDGDGLWSWWEIKPEWDDEAKDWFISIDAPGAESAEAEYATGIPDESGIDWGFAFDTLEGRP